MSSSEDVIIPELTLDELEVASNFVWKQDSVRRTPLVKNVQDSLFQEFKGVCSIHLKLETTQLTGSFKPRGTAYQLHRFVEKYQGSKTKPKVFTFSSGNYGKAFATLGRKMGLDVTVLMMTVAPKNRIELIKDIGADVMLLEPKQVGETIEKLKSEGMQYFSPFDDPEMIRGHSSLAFEILNDLDKEGPPDVMIVCCGGGGLVSSVGAAFRLKGLSKTQIYAVEPETANVMHRCFQAGKRVDFPEVTSVASGLCSPFGGVYTFPYCRKYIDDVLLVSDDEILGAVRRLYVGGFVTEASGAAGIAALTNNKIPLEKLQGKSVVVVLCGGNVMPDELATIFKSKNA